jgi:hypothetical protein
MRIIPIIANIFIVGLFLYSKLIPHKDKLSSHYKGVFNFFNHIFSPIFSFLKRIFKPIQVGQGLSIDFTQIVLLIILLLIGNI